MILIIIWQNPSSFLGTLLVTWASIFLYTPSLSQSLLFHHKASCVICFEVKDNQYVLSWSFSAAYLHHITFLLADNNPFYFCIRFGDMSALFFLTGSPQSNRSAILFYWCESLILSLLVSVCLGHFVCCSFVYSLRSFLGSPSLFLLLFLLD